MARGTPIEAITDAYERYGHLGLAARAVGLKRESIVTRLRGAGLLPTTDEDFAAYRRGWTPREDARVRAQYRAAYSASGSAITDLAAELGRFHGGVVDRAMRLGVTHAEEGAALLSDESGVWGVNVAGGMELGWLTNQHAPTMTVRLPGNPIPKARPRKGGTHFHTPQRVIDAEHRLSMLLATIPLRLTGNVALGCLFALETAVATDGDNLEKLVLDAANDSRLWLDDAQVTLSVRRLTIDRHYPRTIISFQAYTDESIPRGRAHWPVCANCREPFKSTRKNVPRACSPECEADLAKVEAMV